jgi:hypothetical protein
MSQCFFMSFEFMHGCEKRERFPLPITRVFAQSHYSPALADIGLKRQEGGYALNFANEVDGRNSRFAKSARVVKVERDKTALLWV